MKRVTPPIWESLRCLLRDGALAKLSAIEQQLKQQTLSQDLKAAIEAQILWARSEPDAARKHITSTGPAGPYSKLILAHFLIDAGELGQASQLLESAAQGGVADPRVAAGKGAIALARNHVNDALRWLNQSLEQDPKNWHARYLLGLARVASGEIAVAREAFETVTREHPAYEPAWLGYAAQSIALGLGADAAKVIEKTAKKHPEWFRMQIALADCHRQSGDLSRAIHVLTPLASRTKDPEFLLDYSELCLAAGHLPVASATLNVVDEIENSSVRACILRGHICEMSEPRQLEVAVTWYRRAIELAPSDVRAKTALALLLMRDTRVKDWTEAGTLLESACHDEKPPQIAPLLNLAILRVSEGRNDEARKLAAEVLARSPANPGVIQQAEQVLAAAG